MYTGSGQPEYNARHDWNSLFGSNNAFTADKDLTLANFSTDYYPHADDFVRYLEAFSKTHKLNMALNTTIVRVTKSADGVFVLMDGEGQSLKCKKLIVATGLSKPIETPLMGWGHSIPMNKMSTDPHDYEGKDVLIIGSNNYALSLQDALTPYVRTLHVIASNPHEYHLSNRYSWNSHYPGDMRAINDAFVDIFSLKSDNTEFWANISSSASRARALSMHMS